MSLIIYNYLHYLKLKTPFFFNLQNVHNKFINPVWVKHTSLQLKLFLVKFSRGQTEFGEIFFPQMSRGIKGLQKKRPQTAYSAGRGANCWECCPCLHLSDYALLIIFFLIFFLHYFWTVKHVIYLKALILMILCKLTLTSHERGE